MAAFALVLRSVSGFQQFCWKNSSYIGSREQLLCALRLHFPVLPIGVIQNDDKTSWRL